jgi:menaquinone-specific isochorismate synthase
MSLIARIQRLTPSGLDLSGKSVFLHKDRQILASGEAIRVVAKGRDRIHQLSLAWQKLLQDFEITNESGIESAGIIALVSVAFSEKSDYESVLIVPQRTQVITTSESFEVIVGESQPNPKLTHVVGEFAPGAQSEAAFLDSVSAALGAIESGALEKVVLARDLVLPITGTPDLGPALQRLHQRYPECWTYKIGNVFGATPEILLRAQDGEVSARVLAGTAARGTDPDVDVAISDGLSHSQKNKHEHEFAVQSLVRELTPFCSGVEFAKEPFSLVLPDLWHLATDVTGKLLDNVTLFDVIEKLHPTAAVAGTPTDAATQLLAELEPFDRGGYAGPVGWLSSGGSGEIAIALRGGVIEDGQIRALAGSGIVAESLPEAELVETELKFRAVRWAFQSTN